MIITKTPFRISFCGGGSDLASFYKEHGGCVLSTTINKYMYLSVHPYFDENKTVLKYSKTEIVDSLEDIEHRIFKQVLKEYNVSGVELTSTADIPSGTGLGSSSAFTVGLLNTLNCYIGKYKSRKDLADHACRIEIDELKAAIGKQDQYAAAVGGLNFIEFMKNGDVRVDPVITNRATRIQLEKNLMMFYTGITRDANSILEKQKSNMKQMDKVENLKVMCQLAREMKTSLEENQLNTFGEILNESWQLKKSLAKGISNEFINEKYEIALKNGALGGKLLGAGGGGFLLFYCEEKDQDNLRNAINLKEMKFSFEHDGTSNIFIGDKYW